MSRDRAKVLHVCTVDLSLRYLLLNQLRFLQSCGYDVVGVSSPGPDVPTLQAAGVRHIAVPMARAFTPVDDLRALDDLVRVFRRERPDIVHAHNPKPGLLAQMAARAAGVPVVVNTIHGFYFHEHMPRLRRRFYVLMEQIAASCSDAILSQNPEDIATAEAEHIAKPGFIQLLGNGIDLTRFHPARIPRDDVIRTRAALGIGADDIVIGFVGRLVQEKGILELLQAFAQVHARHPRTRLLIVGPTDVDKADALTPTSLLQRFGLHDAVVFAGMRQDMPELYASMDLFVLPSWREGFPRSPMEAAAMGRAVVATDIRGCREVVRHDDTGLLVPWRDADALAAAIESLVDDDERRARMGQAGRALAVQRFDERAVFQIVADTYARLFARPTTRGA